MRLFILIGLILSNCAIAASAKQNLQNTLDQIKSIQANFKQTIGKGNRILGQTSGTLAMKRPGRFRWQTKKPKQLVIADNKRLYVYDQDLNQVTVQSLSKGVGGSPALFFIAYRRSVLNGFNISQRQKGAEVTYTIIPQETKANFKYLKLTFNGLQIKRIYLRDNLGQVAKMVLRNVKVNPRLSQAWFYFKPPKGADVVYR